MVEVTLVSIPIIVALVQGIKLTAGITGSRWSFVLSLGVGIILSGTVAALGEEPVTVQFITNGLIAALAASGLYSGGKTVVEG